MKLTYGALVEEATSMQEISGPSLTDKCLIVETMLEQREEKQIFYKIYASKLKIR